MEQSWFVESHHVRAYSRAADRSYDPEGGTGVGEESSPLSLSTQHLKKSWASAGFLRRSQWNIENYSHSDPTTQTNSLTIKNSCNNLLDVRRAGAVAGVRSSRARRCLHASSRPVGRGARRSGAAHDVIRSRAQARSRRAACTASSRHAHADAINTTRGAGVDIGAPKLGFVSVAPTEREKWDFSQGEWKECR